MSEWSMMTKTLDWKLSYPLFCLAMVMVGLGTWLFMKKVIDRGVVRPQAEPGNTAVDRQPRRR
jgi:hypothetical protein